MQEPTRGAARDRRRSERARARLARPGRAYVEFAVAEPGLFEVGFSTPGDDQAAHDVEEPPGPYALLGRGARRSGGRRGDPARGAARAPRPPAGRPCRASRAWTVRCATPPDERDATLEQVLDLMQRALADPVVCLVPRPESPCALRAPQAPTSRRCRRLRDERVWRRAGALCCTHQDARQPSKHLRDATLGSRDGALPRGAACPRGSTAGGAAGDGARRPGGGGAGGSGAPRRPLEPREDVDEVIDVDAGGVPARLYTPSDSGDDAGAGVVVHTHGGGFVFNDVEVHDAVACCLANRTGLRVLSVDYRLPPEHRFPAAVDDVAAAGGLGRAGGLGGALLADGDSAGGNLALVDALRHPGRYAAVALIYPFLDPTASETDPHGRGRLRPDEGALVLGAVRRHGGDLTHPDLAPLLSDRLGTLPPTLVVTAEHDPPRDEGEAGPPAGGGRRAEVDGHALPRSGARLLAPPAVFPAAEPLTGQVAAFLRQHAG